MSATAHAILAPYATHPEKTRGRLVPEDECSMRTPHQRDRDRIIHSVAFRRLEYKTQVFVNHEGDHYRTRLTHSLEVAQLARGIARCLRLNEDLAEALALAHDLGHPPFGHAGEEGLNEAMQGFGGFDHNAQTIRIVTHLENRYADFDGLNLTWETLEGIAKHNGPLSGHAGMRPLPRAMLYYAQQQDLELSTHASAEAQVAAIADDIAYNNHDIDDGLRAGFFTLDALEGLPLLGEIIDEVRSRHPTLSVQRQSHEIIRRLINRMVADVLATTQARIAEYGIGSSDDVRHLGRQLVQFSPGIEQAHKAIKSFLFKYMYRHFKVNRMTSKARRVVGELFRFFHAEPNCLPNVWYAQTDGAESLRTAEVIADFIAGMTDRFALEEHARIFDPMSRT
ncbi:MAG: deoxyguanosinetriphosphate triphosphohydrolase [Alphaproteobacteria bacterium]|nr:deoxyguanosinetriphosphate triphosphohydrolase [Alphaproteobacteria bacterium]